MKKENETEIAYSENIDMHVMEKIRTVASRKFISYEKMFTSSPKAAIMIFVLSAIVLVVSALTDSRMTAEMHIKEIGTIVVANKVIHIIAMIFGIILLTMGGMEFSNMLNKRKYCYMYYAKLNGKTTKQELVDAIGASSNCYYYGTTWDKEIHKIGIVEEVGYRPKREKKFKLSKNDVAVEKHFE